MQTYTIRQETASISAPVAESPERAQRCRLAASLERWQRTADYYRARGMRTELRKAERVIERTERALELAGFVVSSVVS
jgi:hypothetical protein